MTDEIAHARCQARRTLVNPSSCNADQNFTKLGPYADEIKSLLGPRLENRIRWLLQEFVCNSKSRYARQFPRVKKFLDIVAAWADCFDVSGKDTDVRREMIKHAIEYLLKDGSVTQFADPVVFNSGPNKVDPDSLAAERNACKSMNVWRFINEKDYWLCQDCAIDSVDKENCNSDLDVEVGSISRETSTLYYTCRTTSACGPLCEENVDGPNSSQGNVDCQSFHIIIEQNQKTLNSQQENTNNCSEACCDPTTEVSQKFDIETQCNCNSKVENSKSLHTQTSLPLCYFVLNLHQNILNPREEIPRNYLTRKPCSTKENVKLTDKGINCNMTRDTFPRNSKLKLYVHKATSTSDSKIRNPPKISNLSLPCKSSQLIVRLFEADPSLSDSCLILMKKKFEKDIRNACSCMNDSLRKLEACVIKQLCLNCVIRSGRVDLNVGRRNCGRFNARRFLARVPTCSSVHKRDSGTRNVDTSRDREAERSKDFPVDSSLGRDATRREIGFEERKGDSFYICQNLGTTGVNQVSFARQEFEKEENSGEVTLMWTRGKKKKVDFVLSIESIKSTKQEDYVASTQDDTNGECDEICDEEKSILLDEKLRDDEDKTVEDCHTCGHVADANEHDSECKTLGSCDLDCSCSTDSLKGDTFTEENSTTGGCNPEQCFCHALHADGTVDQDQRTGACATSFETTNHGEGNGEVERSRDLEENGFKVKKFTLSKNTNAKYTADDLKMKEMVLMKEERVDELKRRVSSLEPGTRVERNISDGKEEKKSALEVKDKYSVDSICCPNSTSTLNSCGSKCSNCGNDLPNSTFDKDTTMVIDDTIKDTDINLKTDQTSNLIPTKYVITSDTTKDSTAVQSAKLEVPSKIIDQSNMGSKNLENDPVNVSQKSPPSNPQKNSTDREDYHESNLINNESKGTGIFAEKSPSIPESLFVFCRKTSLKYSSSATNSTSDDECICCDYLSTRRQRARTKFQLPCDRSIPTTFQRTSSRLARCNPSCSTRNLHRASPTKQKPRRKTTEEDGDRVGPRHKNRSWRGSIVPGSLCSSFPAIDRLKYLIRKKLRKLLLEERDKGTSTSKTYLRNERYLVSVSSGKLSRGMAIRDSCSTRCAFTARNRYETEGGPDTMFTEGTVLKKKREIFADGIRDRCQRMIQGHDASKKIRVDKVSATVRQKYSSKSTDTQDLMDEKREVFVKSKFKFKKENRCPIGAPVEGRDKGKISSGLSLNSTGMIVFDDEDDSFVKNHNLRSCKNNRNFPFVTNLSNIRSGNNNCECSSSESSPDNKRNVRGPFGRDRTRREVYRPFEKRLFRIEEDRVEDYDFVRFFSDYQKRINDLDADFRLKLLQYVALCRSVKNSLIKRLHTDDVYEVSSSSAWGRKSFRD